MKKFISVLAAILVITSVSTLFSSCGIFGKDPKMDSSQTETTEPLVVVLPDGKTYYRNKETVVFYRLDAQNIEVQTDNDKSLALQSIFLNMKKISKSEVDGCKFSDDFMVMYDGKKYFVAQDGCTIIKHKGKYYKTSVSDRRILDDIFKHYGVKNIYQKSKY